VPTAKKVVPSGPDWFHEIKYDGYRLRLERGGDRRYWADAALI
jgi:bifunctional non-homologous end joining protein LigD